MTGSFTPQALRRSSLFVICDVLALLILEGFSLQFVRARVAQLMSERHAASVALLARSQQRTMRAAVREHAVFAAPVAPLLVALSFGHSAIFTILLQ